MANFMIQFPLKTEKFQEDILNKRFKIAEHVYNSLVHVTKKRYQEMIKTKKYRELILSLTGNKECDKNIWKQIEEMRKQYNLSEYSFHKDVKPMQKQFKNNIDSQTAQKIASYLWKSYQKLFYGSGKKVYLKKHGSLNTLEGKSNKSGIRFKDDMIFWNGLKLPVMIDYRNDYEYQAMKNEICYCRIVRKFIKNKYKFYVQIVLKGYPPIKKNHLIGNGKVGLDIGTATIAISSESDVKILELASEIQNIENIKQKLLRKMDRSRRKCNPNNFNEDGTIKKSGNKKMKWVKSNRYKKHQNQLKELYRKQADIRKYQHECLANYIISLGDNIYVEKMNFAGLQKRAKKTEKNEKGKFKKKKRYGKTIANKAPKMLLSIIDRKLRYFNKELIEVNTYEIRASQFNHFDETYEKKSLSQRWNDFNGIRLQRDMYSAFLIMNVNDDLKSINVKKCNENFDNFYYLHNLEVNRLKGKKNLKSIAI